VHVELGRRRLLGKQVSRLRRLCEQFDQSLLSIAVGNRLAVLVLTDVLTPRRDKIELQKAVGFRAVPVEAPPQGSGP
jgi:hypothetical protein